MEVVSGGKGLSGIINEGQMKTILFLSLLFLSAFTFPLRGADNALPRVTIVSSDASFIRTVYWESNSGHYPGTKYSTPACTSGSFLLYEYRLRIIIHGPASSWPMPLYLKLISPERVSQYYCLQEDVSNLRTEEVYFYKLGIETNESGWYTAQITNSDGSQNGIPEEEIILDKIQVYFR